MTRQLEYWKTCVLTIAIGCLMACVEARGGETLYNGIVLPENWPPNVRTIGSTPAPVPYYLQGPPAVIPINTGRQLFVDSFLIESKSEAVSQKFHAATVHKNAVLAPDKSWEAGVGGNPPSAIPFSGGVWFDPQDKNYKMWYTAGYGRSMCCAQSADGLTWTKPSLDVVSGTNIVYNTPHDGGAVWIDQQTADPAQRYKMLTRDNATGQHTIRYSADGVHWGATAATAGAAGDRTTFFYNPFRNRWVMSLRADAYNPATESVTGTYAVGHPAPSASTGGVPRMRRYAEGTTLAGAATSWPSAAVFGSDDYFVKTTIPTMWVGADSLDPVRPDRGITTELYNLDCVAYESVMTGMFSIWHGPKTSSPDRDKINDVCVGFSRDGFYWDRTSREPIVGVSEDSTAWNYSNVQSAGGCFLTVGNQLYVYSSGRQGRDSGVCSTGLSTMRRDGFASMTAGAQEGTLTTRPVRFDGKYLFVNADAVGGRLQAEVLDQNGNVIPQYSRNNCTVMSSDSTTARITWNGAGDLSSLAGQAVKIRFYLSKGSLYSFWVSPDQSGASYGYVGAGGPGFTGPIDTVGTSGTALTSVKAAADTVISGRPDLRALNAGGAAMAGIGTGGAALDAASALVRFDLSSHIGKTAAGNGTLTLRQLVGQLPVNFNGQTLDLYVMPSDNANWQEGAGQMTAVAGAAWNRKTGPYSTSPLTANKWSPTDLNNPTSGLQLVDSIVWDDVLADGSAVFSISEECLNQWLGAGVVSFLIRSDSAETLLGQGDLTQRTWYMATLQSGDGALAPRLDFAIHLPEPGTISLMLSAVLGGGFLTGRRCFRLRGNRK
jgi:hypothetical protein